MCSLEWWTIRYYIRIFVIFNILKWHTRALCWWGPQFWNFYMLTTQRYIKLFVIRVTSRNCRQHWIWRKKSSDNSDKWLLRLNIDKCKSVSYCIKQSTDTWLPYYGQKSVIGWSWGVRFDNNVTFRDRISEKNNSLQCPKYYYSVLWIKLRFSTSSSSTRSRWQIEVARLTACRQSRFAIWHCCSSIYGPGGCWETDRQACGALTWRGRHGNVYDIALRRVRICRSNS